MNTTNYMTAGKVAEYLGYHRETIYKMCRGGIIPSHRLRKGGKLLFIKEEIDRWIEARKGEVFSPEQSTQNILKEVIRVEG